MKHFFIFSFILIGCVAGIYAQSDSSIYKHLKTKSFYAVNSSYSNEGSGDHYEVNGKEVTHALYKKYENTWHNMEACCPCILQSYDENDVLLHEAVSCTDCGVGWFKNYYPNGQVQLSGNFKENPTGNWDDIYYRGYCNIPNGTWNYYNENGVLNYTEYWNDGNFLQQVPEQNKTEIWKTTLTINGVPVDTQQLRPGQLKDLVITPLFKNASRDSINLSIQFAISAVGRKYLTPVFTPDSFKQFDLNKLLVDNGFTSADKISYNITVLNNQENIGGFSPDIIADLPYSKSIPAFTKKIIVKDSTDGNFTQEGYLYKNYLVSNSDSTKKIFLKNNGYFLSYSEPVSDSLILRKTITLYGYIQNMTTSELHFNVWSETINIGYASGVSSSTNSYYNGDFDYDLENLRTVPLANINYITYTSPARNFFGNTGNAIFTTSLITTLILAPLLSINLKNGDFKSDTYFALAGSGLIGIVAALPLIPLSNGKTYMLRNEDPPDNNELWHLVYKP